MKQITITFAMTSALLCLALTVALPSAAQDLKPVPPEDIAALKEIVPKKLPASPGHRRILVFWRCEGFVHGKAIEYGYEAFRQLGARHTAYKIDFSKEYADLTAANLRKYDALVLMNTTRLDTRKNFTLEQDLLAFVKSGKGLTSIHAGSDNFYEAEAAAEMTGGRFWGHPWNAKGTWAFTLDEPDHPLNKSFPEPKFKWSDEIYQQESPFYNRAKLRVLVSLDMSDEATAKAGGQKRSDGDYAVSWIRPYGKGRVFYTSFAHDQRAFLNKPILTHIIAGLQYTLGDIKVDDAPGGLSESDLQSVRTADETSLFSAFALLQDVLRNTHHEKVHVANIAKVYAVLSDAAATPCGKQAVLRALTGSGIQCDPASVAPALKVRETRNLAVTLLAGSASREARKILIDELVAAKGADQINLINAMVIRKESDAIIPLMQSGDDAVAVAAISGVGRIADKDSLKALLEFRTEKLKDTHYTALAACIGTMAAHGDAAAVAQAARSLVDSEATPDAVKAACAKALLISDPAFFAEGVLSASEGVRETVVRHADAVDNKMLTASLEKIGDAAKVAVITKLAAKNAGECAAEIAAMLASEKPEVVCAALKALGRVGSAEHVPAMFAKLDAEDARVKRAARYSLEDMHFAQTSKALVRAAGDNIDKQKSALKIIGARMKKNDLPLVGAFLKTDDSGVRQEAWKALGGICDESSIGELLALLPQVQDSDVASAASAVKAAIGNVSADERVVMLNNAWKNDSAPARIALIDVMLRYSDDRYLPLISGAINHSNRKVAESAIRTMGSWPSLAPYDALVAALKTLKDPELKKAAYRGALKLAMDKGGAKTALMCEDLFKNAPIDKERETLATLYFREHSIKLFPLLKGLFDDPNCGNAAKQLYLKFYNEQIKTSTAVAAAELDPKGWKARASHGGRDAAKAFDRDPKSRWTSGVSKKGMWFALDLGQSTYLSEIVLDTSGSARDTPNGYEVYVSSDGKNWGAPATTGDGNSKKITTIKLAATGRHIKIVTTGSRPGLHWSIHEIHVKAGLDPATLDEIRKTIESL